jgi:hypothetical protein
METVFRWLVRLIGLALLSIGLGFVFVPDQLAVQFMVHPTSGAGFATLRGDLGGLFLGLAVFCFLGAVQAGSRWVLVPTVFLGTIILGRFFNLIFEGTVGPGVGPLLFEIVLVLLLVVAQRVLAGRNEG